MGAFTLSAQSGCMNHEEDHEHEHHENEIGVAIAPVYFIKEKSTALGLHLHYVRPIAHSKWGLGAGFEKIFDDHNHNIVDVIISYRPIHRLSFSLSPGINLDNRLENPSFALHGEVAYEFVLGNIHIGPVLDLAKDHEDVHLSLGLHLGYGF